MAKFTITLTENYNTKTYRLTEEMFMSLSFRLEPYRSFGEKSKPIRCIETGKIFNSAMKALSWLSDFGIERNYNNANKIKKVCKGKGIEEKAFGFHWRYANDSDREINNIKKGRPTRWLYYACLKKRIAGRGCSKQIDLCEQGKQVCETPFNAGKQAEVHSKSYKITEKLFNQLKQELAPYCSSRDSKENKGEIMKFEHILNSFNPTVTQVDLTEKRFLCRAKRSVDPK